MPVVIGILVLLLAGVFAVSWKLSGMIVHPDAVDYDRCYLEEAEKGKLDAAKYEGDYCRTEYTLPSPFGYDLHCVWIPRRAEDAPGDGRERVAVIVHGFEFCLLGSVKYVDLFRDLGFHCILYDHRGHGRSGRAPTSMGFFEQADLTAVCEDAYKRFGDNAVLGTHGESMGAATVMLQSAAYKRLAFVIEDCGYSDLSDEIAYKARQLYHLPRFPFVPLASVLSKLRGGVLFSQVAPRDAVAAADPRLPMLFLHGGSDAFVPVEMARENAAAKRGRKRLRIFPNAGHAESFWLNRAAYTAEVTAFFRENRLL